MQRVIQKTFMALLLYLFVSCVSTSNEPYKTLTDDEKASLTVAGSLRITFTADNGLGSSIMTETIKQYAYIQLKEEAAKTYPGNVDIRNITVIFVQGYFPNQEWTASGDIVVPNTTAAVEGSLARAAEQLMSSLQTDTRIAIVYVSSDDLEMTAYIANELEYIMVNKGFTIIDRSQLDKIRREQDLQLSGEVDDDSAVSIGKIAGANVIITGSVTKTDSARRLYLRALSVQTAQVLAAASERL